MAVSVYAWRNDPGIENTRPPQYLVCDTAKDLPKTGLMVGDQAVTKSDLKMYLAISDRTWKEIGIPGTIPVIEGK